jgi:hypothetical protein
MCLGDLLHKTSFEHKVDLNIESRDSHIGEIYDYFSKS